MLMLNEIDFAIIGIILFSLIVSIIRGFVREVLSLTSWFCAFYVTSHFYSYITRYLTYFNDPFVRRAAAIAILFLLTLIICSFISYMISLLVLKTGLSGTDRVLGSCFGVARGILIVAAILFFTDTFTSMSKSQLWKQSVLIPHFNYIIRWFFDFLQNSSAFLR
ncbi:colicin V production protein [Candidatus Schmidhempelia bombi str. Bimp]|uniref:Colicin V production protein n=2 Tax=Candidatus Schmidhempelia TaxID=1505768 RepID=A0AB94IBI5_9GAMM|nr:colicin V production protein [Candidatus Schmidhempelia bombi str. Bimp]